MAMSALKFIYGGANARPIWRDVNTYAASQIEWSEMGSDNAEYLSNVMGQGG